jgi:hypothetical protein
MFQLCFFRESFARNTLSEGIAAGFAAAAFFYFIIIPLF